MLRSKEQMNLPRRSDNHLILYVCLLTAQNLEQGGGKNKKFFQSVPPICPVPVNRVQQHEFSFFFRSDASSTCSMIIYIGVCDYYIKIIIIAEADFFDFVPTLIHGRRFPFTLSYFDHFMDLQGNTK